MPDHCFTYGSLMCDDIMGAVCAAAPLSPLPARLAGFRRAPVIGVEYPGMVPAADGLVEGDVGVRTLLGIVGLEGRHQGIEALFQALQVGIGRPFGSPFGRLAFEHAAEFQHVFAQVGVLAHHVLPGVGKTRLQRIGHVSAATLAAVHHALRGQLLNRLAQARPGNAQLGRELALRRQAIARL